MPFHVKVQHSWETCEGNATTPSPTSGRLRWVEITKEVKVIGAWSFTPEHTAFAVVEASGATKLHQFGHRDFKAKWKLHLWVII